MTPDDVRKQLAGLESAGLLDRFESNVMSIAATEALTCGGQIAEHDFIPYDVFRRELPLVRAELRKRMTPQPCIGADPACPCEDGDACHYRDTPKTKGWPLPAQPPVALTDIELTGRVNLGHDDAADEIERLTSLVGRPKLEPETPLSEAQVFEIWERAGQISDAVNELVRVKHAQAVVRAIVLAERITRSPEPKPESMDPMDQLRKEARELAVDECVAIADKCRLEADRAAHPDAEFWVMECVKRMNALLGR